MKKETRKLTLNRETLGALQEAALRGAAAGPGPTAIDCSVTCLAADDQTSHNCGFLAAGSRICA